MEKYDIFISYSHHDNKEHWNWIHVFCERLTSNYRSRVGREPKIFLDKDGLNVGNTLNGAITAAIDASTLFIPVLSPVYLSSEWCRKEFLYFMKKNRERLILDNKSRIVPLRFRPYDEYSPGENKEAAEVKDIMEYLKGNNILYKDFYRGPLPLRPEDPDFETEIARFTEDIYSLIRDLPGLIGQDNTPEVSGEPAVFLGYAFGPEGAPARALREGLHREWQKQKKYGQFSHRILPDEAPDAADYPRNKSEADVRSFIQRQLKQSDYAVLVFDDVEGPKTSDTAVPVAHLQYRLAAEEARNRPDFRVLAAAKTTEDCASSQLEFVRETEKDAQTNKNILLVGFDVKIIRDFLHDLIHVAPPPPPPSPGVRFTFYIHDRRDRGDELHDKIDDIIFSQRFEALRPVFGEDNPLINADDGFIEFWTASEHTIVLLRHGTAAWCNSVKVAVLKLAALKQKPGLMAICVADPDVNQRLREVRSHEFRVIDCTKPGFENQIVQFLNPASHA